MRQVNIHDLKTLLKNFDIDFAEEKIVDSLYSLDINSLEHQKLAIKLAIKPWFDGLDEVNKDFLMKVLALCISEEDKLEEVFNSISFPFDEKIQNRGNFLKNLRAELFEK